MMKNLVLGCTLPIALMACNSTESTPAATPAPAPAPAPTGGIGTLTESGGVYTVTTNGKTITLPATRLTINGGPAWASEGRGARAFKGNNYSVIAGYAAEDSFAAITGTPVDPGLSGTATYTSKYFATTRSNGSSRSGNITLTANPSAGTLTGASGADFSVAGTIKSGGVIGGTATFGGQTSDMEGGFYGTNEVAGVFNNGEMSGFITGETP